MILVIFATIVLSIIPEKYSKIASIAKQKSHLRTKENLEEEILLPGKFQDGAISFNVKKTFTSTDYQEIRGFAIDTELEAIAVVSNNGFKEKVKNGAALSDKETSTLYQLEEELGNDDDITVYKIHQTNLFSILSNIKIAYDSRRDPTNDIDDDVQGKCQNISSDEEKCNLFYNVGYSKKYKYNEIQDQHPEYIPFTTSLLDSQGKNYSFDVKLGGYSTSSVSYELNFESIQEFKANIKTIGKYIFEAGFRFPKSTIELNNYNISAIDLFKNEDMKKHITHLNYEKFGFNLSVDLYYLYDLNLFLRSLHISNDIEINATAVFDFNNIFTYTTSDDEKIISNLKSFDFDINSNAKNDGNFDDFTFNFFPSIRKSLLFDINVSFYKFNMVSTNIQVGIENRYDTEMVFDNSYNSYCPFPYISYSYSPQYCPVFAIAKPVKLFNFYNLINEKQYVFSPIWVGDKVGPRCFYGIKNPNPKTPIDSPVFFAKEISNLNSNQVNIEVLVGDKRITNFNINNDKELNILHKINSSKDNLTFKGHKFDPNFLNSLFLKFYPNNFEIYSYLQDQSTTITNFYDIDAKFVFNFYQGIELDRNNETICTDTSKFAYFETSENAAIIQHSKGNHYFVPKTKIYDDQFSYEEDYIYHKKNNWKLYLDLHNIQVNATILIVNSNTLATEQSFEYTDNCIFLIENRNLYLQLEFENKETKVVNVDIDFNQKKKILISEKLYHNATIDIILEPYSTIVFFDIDELDCDNEKGFFPSYVLEGKVIYSFNDNNEIISKYDESTQDKKYLVYHFKTDLTEYEINETLFIVLVSQGFYPLSTIEEFPNEMYLVEFNEFSFENGFLVFYIPLVRNRDYKIGDEIKIKAIFAQPLQKEAFCPNSFHFSRFSSKIPIGCIDRSFDYDSILSLTSYDPEGNQYNPSKITPIVSTYIFINIFNNLVDSDCLIARIPTILPEYSLSLSVGEFLANALLSYNVNYLKIKCDRCSGIFRNKEKYQSDDSHDINIKLDPEINDDYYAICSNFKGKYCIQKLELDPTKVTLIKNPMVTVMTVLNYLEDLPQISIPKTQLFASHGQSMILYSKDNIAGLEIDKELDPGFDVTLKAEVKGKHVRLYSVTNDNTYIPFDPLSILSSFEETLNKLGLDSENVQFYHIRDEIFIHEISAFKKYPQDLSSELLFGLPSSIITSINYDYNFESFQVQDIDYLCYCFVYSASQECQPIANQNCTSFVKLTPHEYNNFDVYLPEKGNGHNVEFILNTDVTNYHPNFELLPNDVWKVAVFSGDNSPKRFTGSLYIFPGQKVDCYPSINCGELDVTIEVDVKNRKIGVFDASSSNSEVSINFIITNELQCKVDNYCLYSPDRETLLNVHHLKEYTFNTKHKQVSTTGEYVYDLIDNYNGDTRDSRGHYYLSIVYQENNIHLNEHFCVEDSYMYYCDKDQIPIGPFVTKGIAKYIRSYPNIINHITLHFVECNNTIQPDALIDVSNNHYNIDILMESKSPFVFSDSLILYKNLNVSFGGQLNMENTILRQEVEIGIKQTISLNNKAVKKVEVEIICPSERETDFDSTQVLIHDFDSNIENVFVSESTCQLDHSTLSLSLSVDDSKLILNIQQDFNSYGSNVCLFSDSASKCKYEYGLPIKLRGFNQDLITTNEQVTITLVDDFKCNLNLQSKNIVFKGNTKLSGNLELSSDSTIEIHDLDVNELKLALSLDIGKEEISTIKIINDDSILPHTFHLRLFNPNSNQFTKKFADLNMKNGIEYNWISDESHYENYFISTELIIEEQSVSVKVNHIAAQKVLCYYNTDSTLCPPQTTRDNIQMWKDFNESIIYIAEDINVNSVNFNDHIVYFTGPGKLISNFYFYGSSNVHFIHKQLVEELNLFTFANFNTRKAPKIVFGEFGSKPKSWSLQIQGYDTTCSFELIYNGNLTPDELKNDQNTNLIIENIGPNTVIHFIENYLPNSFCIYNYPYESYCYSEYPQYKPINSKDFWNIKLNPNYEPKFLFASTLTTFLPLQKFQKEKINSAVIEILPFTTNPIFLVPEGFTLTIKGKSSDITAKVSLNTNSFNYGRLLCADDTVKIQLVPVDGEFLYDEDTIIILKQNNYIEFKPILEYNKERKMIELNVIKNTIQYTYTSDKIDELYPFISKELVTLKLTSNCDLNISKLNTEKLVVFGDNYNLNIKHEINTTLKLLLINSANINFDSLLDLEVGVFNSNININPFATKQFMSSDLSYKYDSQIYPLDGSSVTITETSLIVNNKSIKFDKRNIILYVKDFCSIHDSSTKTINIYGGNSSIDIEKSDQSLITFNNFDYLIVNSNDAFSNFHFHNNLLVDFNSPEKAQIDFYNLEYGSGYLISPTAHSSIKQMNLFGKPFYSENADVSSLSVFDNKALMKGVKLTDSLQIDPGASLIAHSSTFQSSISSYFCLTSAKIILILVDSTFDCSNLSVDVEYAYQHKQYTLIKGLESMNSCENLKSKVSSTKKKKDYDLICYENPNDDSIDLIVTNIKNKPTENKLSKGEIAAIFVPIGLGVICGISIPILIYYFRNRNKQNEASSENERTESAIQGADNINNI